MSGLSAVLGSSASKHQQASAGLKQIVEKKGSYALPMLANPCTAENKQQQVQNQKMINEFKTMPCGLEGSMSSHDHRCCPFYHSERDRRRLVCGEGSDVPLYSAEPCSQQFDDHRVCPKGDSCGYCHSTAELLYHPDFFRKRLCHQAKKCPRGRFCAFAHSRQELLVPHFSEVEELEPTENFIAWRFKTQWCPIGGPHDWENCVYAHTYRDWRRVPTLGYSSRPCPHWVQSVTSGPAELTYTDRCPRGMACPLAHGAKEQLYHPQFYKTSPCSEANCKRGVLCAFTHGAHDLRRPRNDDPLPSSVREPILEAMELLGASQPTFWNPPRYHALEDPPKGGGASSRRGRKWSTASTVESDGKSTWSEAPSIQSNSGGRRGRRGQARPRTLLAHVPSMDGPSVSPVAATPPPPPLQPVPANVPAPGPVPSELHNHINHFPGDDPTQAQQEDQLLGMATHPQYYCQWVPNYYWDPSAQLVPPPIGYSQGWGPPMHDGMQQCLMTVPPSAAVRHEQDAAGEGRRSEARMSGQPLLPPMLPMDPSMYNPGMMPMGGVSPMAGSPVGPLVFGEIHLNGLPPWPVEEEAPGVRRGASHRKGLRTPSSLGSPPLSAAPTEAPSPRQVEVTSREGSTYGSSDDTVLREPMVSAEPMAGNKADEKVDRLDNPTLMKLIDAPFAVHSPTKSRSKSVPVSDWMDRS